MRTFTRITGSFATSVRGAILLGAALVVSAAAVAEAQTTGLSGVTVSAHYGIFDYDLSGVGTVRHLAARAELPVASKLLVEGSLGYSRTGTRPDERATLLVAEVQGQVQYPIGRFAPYLGVGGGPLMALAGGAQEKFDAELSLSTAAGVRVRLGERLGARAELRVRGVDLNGDGFTGSTSELTAGLSWRTGR